MTLLYKELKKTLDLYEFQSTTEALCYFLNLVKNTSQLFSLIKFIKFKYQIYKKLLQSQKNIEYEITLIKTHISITEQKSHIINQIFSKS